MYFVVCRTYFRLGLGVLLFRESRRDGAEGGLLSGIGRNQLPIATATATSALANEVIARDRDRCTGTVGGRAGHGGGAADGGGGGWCDTLGAYLSSTIEKPPLHWPHSRL